MTTCIAFNPSQTCNKMPPSFTQHIIKVYDFWPLTHTRHFFSFHISTLCLEWPVMKVLLHEWDLACISTIAMYRSVANKELKFWGSFYGDPHCMIWYFQVELYRAGKKTKGSERKRDGLREIIRSNHKHKFKTFESFLFGTCDPLWNGFVLSVLPLPPFSLAQPSGVRSDLPACPVTTHLPEKH